MDLIIVDSDDSMVFANGFDGEFRENLLNADLVFVLAGAGGRFGSENASLIAQARSEQRRCSGRIRGNAIQL